MQESVAQRLEQLRSRISATGCDPSEVTIVGVTKGFPSEVVTVAQTLGIDAIGENYAQELLQKQGELARDINWHFLGALQRNKIPSLAPYVHCFQGLARVEEIATLARVAPKVDVFIEVNTMTASGRGGAQLREVPGLVEEAQNKGLNVRGLMTVAPFGGDAREAFSSVRKLVDSLGLKECSMGMSGDLEVALQEGSTMVRVGEALFGPRPIRRKNEVGGVPGGRVDVKENDA